MRSINGEAASAAVSWMASSSMVWLLLLLTGLQPPSSSSIMVLAIFTGPCDDMVNSSLIAEEDTSKCPLPHELPLLSISVDCTSGQVVINRTDSIPAELVGKAIVDMIFEYKATNRSSGESEHFHVARNSYKDIVDFGIPIIDFHDDFSDYEFKACLAIQTYPCWFLNDQKLSCTFEEEDPSYTTPLSSSAVVTMPTTTSPMLVFHSSTDGSKHNNGESTAIRSTTTSTLPATSSSTTPIIGEGNDQQQQSSTVTAVVVPLCIVGFGVVVVLVVCFISVSGRRILSKRRGGEHTYMEDANKADTMDLNSFPNITVEVDGLSIGSIATEYEGVKFELSLLNAAPPPMYSERDDNKLHMMHNSSPLKNSQDEMNLKNLKNIGHHTANIIPKTNPPLQTDDGSHGNPGHTHTYRLNTVSSCDEGYVGTGLQSLGDDDAMLSEVASDLDQSVVMGYDDNNIVESPTTDDGIAFPIQKVTISKIEHGKQNDKTVKTAPCSKVVLTDHGYLPDQSNPAPSIDSSGLTHSNTDTGYMPNQRAIETDVDYKKSGHFPVKNICRIHTQEQMTDTNGYISSATENNTSPQEAEQLTANLSSSCLFSATDGHIPDESTTTTVEEGNCSIINPAASAVTVTSNGYIPDTNIVLDDKTTVTSDGYISDTADTGILQDSGRSCDIQSVTSLALDDFVIETPQMTIDDSKIPDPADSSNGYVSEQGQSSLCTRPCRLDIRPSTGNGYVPLSTSQTTDGCAPISTSTDIEISLIDSMEVDLADKTSSTPLELTIGNNHHGYIPNNKDSIPRANHCIGYATVNPLPAVINRQTSIISPTDTGYISTTEWSPITNTAPSLAHDDSGLCLEPLSNGGGEYMMNVSPIYNSNSCNQTPGSPIDGYISTDTSSSYCTSLATSPSYISINSSCSSPRQPVAVPPSDGYHTYCIPSPVLSPNTTLPKMSESTDNRSSCNSDYCTAKHQSQCTVSTAVHGISSQHNDNVDGYIPLHLEIGNTMPAKGHCLTSSDVPNAMPHPLTLPLSTTCNNVQMPNDRTNDRTLSTDGYIST